jgi:hypothetical protein
LFRNLDVWRLMFKRFVTTVVVVGALLGALFFLSTLEIAWPLG